MFLFFQFAKVFRALSANRRKILHHRRNVCPKFQGALPQKITDDVGTPAVFTKGAKIGLKCSI